MTGKIFKEYLLWFDGKMAGRQVILLIDGFLAHHAGLNLFQEEFPRGLTNTKVIFLPTNATSVCQPLDQGIIKAWKAQYRKKWVRFLCSEYRQDKDPLKTINVLQAIRWSIEAWEQDITRTTIENCWVNARVLSANYGPRNRGEENDLGWKELVEAEEDGQRAVNREIEEGIRNLARQNRISTSMAIGQFLNPQEENVDDGIEVIVDEIAKAYSIGNRTHETDEEDVIVPKVGYSEAIQALQKLCLYEEQNDNGDSEWISRINRHKRVMRARGFQGLKQSSTKEFLE